MTQKILEMLHEEIDAHIDVLEHFAAKIPDDIRMFNSRIDTKLKCVNTLIDNADGFYEDGSVYNGQTQWIEVDEVVHDAGEFWGTNYPEKRIIYSQLVDTDGNELYDKYLKPIIKDVNTVGGI